MKLTAHINADGQIKGLVAIPKGELNGGLTAPPGAYVCEIEAHGLDAETADPDKLAKLLETHVVQFTAAQGKLVPQRK